MRPFSNLLNAVLKSPAGDPRAMASASLYCSTPRGGQRAGTTQGCGRCLPLLKSTLLGEFEPY
ncbi:hypothetical protein PLANPX_3350 [Lacipirellula parvula]|uniref:Uncharacterized protein n=1 Tax=Lacipirellula parvula TaxID=2650471 RepID=A0A5K7XB69_9BACT|nr:hypothetical protein PLANPX_3350 [Lacipirellula parvula]